MLRRCSRACSPWDRNRGRPIGRLDPIARPWYHFHPATKMRAPSCPLQDCSCASPSFEIEQVPPATRLVSAVARLLAFQAKLRVGHDVQALADGLFALFAKAEQFGIAFDSCQGAVDPPQDFGTSRVALGRDDLCHFNKRLLILVASHARLVLARGLDGHVALGEDAGTQVEQALFPSCEFGCFHVLVGCHKSGKNACPGWTASGSAFGSLSLLRLAQPSCDVPAKRRPAPKAKSRILLACAECSPRPRRRRPRIVCRVRTPEPGPRIV